MSQYWVVALLNTELNKTTWRWGLSFKLYGIDCFSKMIVINCFGLRIECISSLREVWMAGAIVYYLGLIRQK